MPHTIEENLARLQAATTAIGNAITTKGGTVSSGDGLEEFVSDIATIPSGGSGSYSANDVNFYDYDGTIVQSYSANDFANLSELPVNPTHEGLTGQGWNWSLAEAKTYVATYGHLNIGQMYITSDGKTRIYISLSDGRTSPVLNLYLNANSELDVDWGDESTHSTLTATSAGYANKRHAYSASGDYVITITVVNGGFDLQSSSTGVSSILWNGNFNSSSPDRAYNIAIKKIEIGAGVKTIDSYAFLCCYSLSSITIPKSVTTIGLSAFNSCYSLSSVTIPNGITSIGNKAFYYCYGLSSVSIPNGVTSIGSSAFTNCYSLSSVTIPNSVTSIEYEVFNSCYSLSSVTIPNSVTSIGNYSFAGCYTLSSMAIPDNVSSIGLSAFVNCYSLSSVSIPNGITIINTSAFSTCYALSSVSIPDSVETIDGYAFSSCYSLSSITIPDSVTSINTKAFSSCGFISYIKFESTTPPTVTASNAWTGVSTSTRILVPMDTYGAYTTKTNYPNPSSYKYFVYATYESGTALPTTSADNYNLTWYATVDDAVAGTNPITVGNGNEVYAKCVAV